MSPSTSSQMEPAIPELCVATAVKISPFSGTRPSCCSCSWIRNFVAVALIAEAASCQSDNHQRQHAQADKNRHVTAVFVYHSNGKRLIQDRQKRVKRGMHQDRHEQAALRVVEDPGHDDSEDSSCKDKHNNVQDGGRKIPNRSPE